MSERAYGEQLSGASQALEEKGEGRVLVVDGGGSHRCALLGDNIAEMGYKNGWSVSPPSLPLQPILLRLCSCTHTVPEGSRCWRSFLAAATSGALVSCFSAAESI